MCRLAGVEFANIQLTWGIGKGDLCLFKSPASGTILACPINELSVLRIKTLLRKSDLEFNVEEKP
jgi:hypothetical protein